MSYSRRRRLRLRFGAVIGVFIGGGTPAWSQNVVQARLEQTGVISSNMLREASGVAASRTHEGVLWTHNDSGDEPRIYAIGYDGGLIATYRVRRGEARDWEDIALGPCPGAAGDCLYIADTGDNNRRRNSVRIFIVPEPDVSAAPPLDSVLRTERAQTVSFRYPQHRAYDVEALGVAPDGEILLITKGRDQDAGVVQFRIRFDEVPEDEITAEFVARLPIIPVRHVGRWVTGAAISRSGNRVVVRTYTELFFFDRAPDGTLTPDPPSCWVGGAEPQGEGVDFIDEETVVLVSEALLARRGTVFRGYCPRD